MSARFGTKVKITVVQADMGEDCELDSLQVYDSGSDDLAYPGLSSQCGEDEFPPSYEKIISDGPVTVKFESKGTSGTAKFKIVVEATEPDCEAAAQQPGEFELCPSGPCCEGEDCCVVSLGSYPVQVRTFCSNNFIQFPLIHMKNLILAFWPKNIEKFILKGIFI